MFKIRSKKAQQRYANTCEQMLITHEPRWYPGSEKKTFGKSMSIKRLNIYISSRAFKKYFLEYFLAGGSTANQKVNIPPSWKFDCGPALVILIFSIPGRRKKYYQVKERRRAKRN